MSRRKSGPACLAVLSGAIALTMLGPAASAQIGAGLGRSIRGTLGQALQAPGMLGDKTLDALDPRTLLDQRLDRLDSLVRSHPRELERDEHGAPVVSGEVIALAPNPDAMEAARHAGFKVEPSTGTSDGLGLVVLRAPPGLNAREAVKQLRKLDPAGVYDFNHLYQPSGEAAVKVTEPAPTRAVRATSVRLGLVDTGVDASGEALAHARIQQQGFAGARVKPAAHGTAVASLLVGDATTFRGAAPGAELYVADVYGGLPTGGAADTLVRGLGWLASNRVRVINISLVGPPNLVLGAAVKALQAKGVTVVAAVGNDGPAAPLAYPASYSGVIAVTGVDAQGRVLLEAGHAEHLDFAAPGADMAASAEGGGYVSVRGTSFAAPLVAGRLAVLMAAPDASPQTALSALAAEGRHRRAYGRGLVAIELRTPPAKVAAQSKN